MSQWGNNNEFALQHGGFCTMWSLVAKGLFPQWLSYIPLVVETKLKNIRCFIVFIVILVLDSFRKQGIVFWFFALEYEAGEIK